MTAIAILGLGAMGVRMAGRLLAAGHQVTVWNRTPDRAEHLVEGGARLAASPAEAAAISECCIAMVRDEEASCAVWLGEGGALAALPEEALAVECSTVGPAWARTLSARAASRSIGFLDAPVVGSRPQAEAGELIFLAGGDAAAVEKFRPRAAEMGKALRHCGESGAGAAAKLIVNGLFAVQLAAMAEMIGLADGIGVDADRVLPILSDTAVFSPAMRGAGAAMLAGDWKPLFPIDLVAKDLRLVADAGREGSAATPLTALAMQLYAEARDAGLGGDNINGIVQRYRSAC